MSHAPFIWSSYVISAVILLWTALAPLLKQRSAMRDIRRLERSRPETGEGFDDTDT